LTLEQGDVVEEREAHDRHRCARHCTCFNSNICCSRSLFLFLS
jgi:hypothetical protein